MDINLPKVNPDTVNTVESVETTINAFSFFLPPNVRIALAAATAALNAALHALSNNADIHPQQLAAVLDPGITSEKLAQADAIKSAQPPTSTA